MLDYDFCVLMQARDIGQHTASLDSHAWWSTYMYFTNFIASIQESLQLGRQERVLGLCCLSIRSNELSSGRVARSSLNGPLGAFRITVAYLDPSNAQCRLSYISLFGFFF